MMLYGLYHLLFKKFCWKWEWLRTVGIIATPILEGCWVGHVKTAQNPIEHDVTVTIGQDWTEILIRLKGPHSHSRSTAASMTVSEDETSLIYEYVSEPNPDAVETLQIHYGTAHVTLNACNLEGEYYTGRGRLTVGTIRLHRNNSEPSGLRSS
jgi:hypothetical protein